MRGSQLRNSIVSPGIWNHSLGGGVDSHRVKSGAGRCCDPHGDSSQGVTVFLCLTYPVPFTFALLQWRQTIAAHDPLSQGSSLHASVPFLISFGLAGPRLCVLKP